MSHIIAYLLETSAVCRVSIFPEPWPVSYFQDTTKALSGVSKHAGGLLLISNYQIKVISSLSSILFLDYLNARFYSRYFILRRPQCHETKTAFSDQRDIVTNRPSAQWHYLIQITQMSTYNIDDDDNDDGDDDDGLYG